MSDKLRELSDEFSHVVDEYLEGYEFLGEDDQGREGYSTPNEKESMLIYDAIQGLIADDDFTNAFNAWQIEVAKAKEKG